MSYEAGVWTKILLKCVLTDSVNNSILKKNLWPQGTRPCHKYEFLFHFYYFWTDLLGKELKQLGHLFFYLFYLFFVEEQITNKTDPISTAP